MKFSRKNVIEFHALCHLPSERHILMTVTPNLTKLEPMKTRHPELSRDIKFEEIRVRKDLQTIAWKSDQKLGKRRNSQTRGRSGRVCDGVPINTRPPPPPQKMVVKIRVFWRKKRKRKIREKNTRKIKKKKP